MTDCFQAEFVHITDLKFTFKMLDYIHTVIVLILYPIFPHSTHLFQHTQTLSPLSNVIYHTCTVHYIHLPISLHEQVQERAQNKATPCKFS
jgi:hypothetical protein